MSAGLHLSAVVARDRRGPRGRAWGALAGVTASFEAGVHAVVGAPADGTIALVDVVSGALRPRRGKVLLEGREPARDVGTRRRMGVLGYAPELPPLGTVGAFAGRLGVSLEGVEELLDRDLEALSRREARRVELALALGTARPALLVLFEPWSAWSPSDAQPLALRLRARADEGAVVLVVSSELGRGAPWVDHVHLLSQGHIVGRDRELGWPLAAPAWLDVTLASAEQARTLAAGLLATSAVHSLACDGVVVSLQTPEHRQAADAIAAIAVARELDVRSMQASPPTRASLLLQAHRLYEHRAAMARAPAVPAHRPPAVAAPSPVLSSATESAPPPVLDAQVEGETANREEGPSRPPEDSASARGEA